MAHISAPHAEFLAGKAVTPTMMERFELTTVETVEELPEELKNFPVDLAPGLPGLVFWWTEPDGRRVPQIKLIEQTVQVNGDYVKYVFPVGAGAKLGEFRKADGDTVLITEGTKQSLVAAEYAPEGMGVYGIAGCRNWSTEGVPTPHLQVVDGKHVLVLLDSDAASNLDVYDAGLALAEACKAEGAESVRFVRLPGGKKSALDDLLGTREEGRRTAMLKRLLDGAGAKPADTKPKASKSKDKVMKPDGERGVIVVNDDRYLVINALTNALVGRWNRTRLFNYGGIICQRDNLTMRPVTKDQFNDVIQETAITVHRAETGDSTVDTYAYPEGVTAGAVLSRAGSFAQLDKLSQIPFVRIDGTICSTSGYDEASRSYLALAKELEGVTVPEQPTPGEVKAAVELLVDDLLQGFPFPTDADRANAIATVLTPFIRDLVPVSPLAVIDGKEAGSGKNLFADVVSIIVTGRSAQPLPYSTDDAEQRKVITSAFRSGASMFVFDEAHRIEGASMARALTSHTYQDRVLGVSNLAEFPNNVTWMSLGNNVQVFGDLARRVYRVRIEYQGESPENRPETDFKHPDLRAWATGHRAELVRACLTLVRAWFSAGQPKGEVPFRMGSFETWQSTIAGVLANAGVTGFLAGMKEWRSESDFERKHWVAHFQWLHDTFGEGEFTTAQVTRKLREARDDAEYPHEMTDASKEGFSRQLGVAYARQNGRTLDGFTLSKLDVTGHGKVGKWRVTGPSPFTSGGTVPNPDKPGPSGEGSGGSGGDPTPTYVGENMSLDAGSAHTHVFPGGGGGRVSSASSTPSPIGSLLHLADGPALMPCPECGTPQETFGAAGILRACPTCHPATFGR
jgi:hypothetical protein